MLDPTQAAWTPLTSIATPDCAVVCIVTTVKCGATRRACCKKNGRFFTYLSGRIASIMQGTSGRCLPSPAVCCSARPPRHVRLPPVCPVRLLDHLICQQEQGGGHRDPERLRGLQVDDELKLHRLLHRQVGGLGPL